MEYRISKNIGWFCWHRLLPALLLVVPLAISSLNFGLVSADAGMVPAVLMSIALIFALVLVREPTKLSLGQDRLVATGFCYMKKIAYPDLQSILTTPYSAPGLFEITFSINGSADSIKMLDSPNAKVFRERLLSVAPRIQCYGE